MTYWRQRERFWGATKYNKALAILVSAFLLPSFLNATSIVVIITRHDIFIGADGKTVFTDLQRQSFPKSRSIGQKLLVLQDRVIVGACGTLQIVGEPHDYYSFQDIFADIETYSMPTTTVRGVAEIIRNKLKSIFYGFDTMLASGAIKKEHLARPQDVLLKFLIVGYQDRQAQLYSVQMNIDWKTLHLKEPVIEKIYPDHVRKNSFGMVVGEPNEGAWFLFNDNSKDPRIIAIRNSPEIRKLRDDLDLDKLEGLKAVCEILNEETIGNAEVTGYPLTIHKISSTNGIETNTFEKACLP